MKKFTASLLAVAALFAASQSSLHAQTKIADAVKGKLVSMQGVNIAPFDSNKLDGVKYYALYFSASWCPPCRAFTPELVAFYNRMKPLHPDFELIFRTFDHSVADAQKYIKTDHMKWPAIRFAQLSQANAISKYCGSGIPCLVFVDADGKVISDSVVNKKYVGPEKVLNDMQQFLNQHPASAANVALAPAANAIPTPAPIPTPTFHRQN